MGIEERTIGSVPKDFRLSKDSAQRVPLYPHRDQDEPPYPCPSNGCLTFSNISLIRSEYPMKGSTGFLVNVPGIPDLRQPSCQFYGYSGCNKLHGLPPPFAVCGLYGSLILCKLRHLRSHTHSPLARVKSDKVTIGLYLMLRQVLETKVFVKKLFV